jgi:hypothetical protein
MNAIERRLGKGSRRPVVAHTLGHPRRRLCLHPMQGFEAGLKFVNLFNRAIRPFGLYLPVLAIFKNHTKYRSSRRHVCTHQFWQFGDVESDPPRLVAGLASYRSHGRGKRWDQLIARSSFLALASCALSTSAERLRLSRLKAMPLAQVR